MPRTANEIAARGVEAAKGAQKLEASPDPSAAQTPAQFAAKYKKGNSDQTTLLPLESALDPDDTAKLIVD